ncbi:MAG TPA: zinc-dependent peptidase [Flavobacteriales bacterium]
MGLLGGFFVLLFFGGILYMVLYFALGVAGIGLHGLLPLRQGDRALLMQHCAFYTALPHPQRKRFERRVKELMLEKDWIGRGLPITAEIRVRISAAIAQVTFGFDDLLLLHFRRIAVYPDAYRNPRTGAMHIGEAAPGAGLLIFSWKHFVEGFNEPHNARNVGLHEVAHALWFENMIPNAEDDFLDAATLERWRQLARDEADRIQAGEGRLFRNYAATNQAEFFAVAVEYFFEQPGPFNERMPDLYATLRELLHQDPLITPTPA